MLTMMRKWSQDHSLLPAVLSKSFRSLALVVVVAPALLLVGNAAWTDDGKSPKLSSRVQGAVRLLKTVPVPVSAVNTTAGALYSFDISWVDQATGTYYLADRSNIAVDSVDA